ncbi:MAG: PEP-CTERM sorting domain-containing protein [Cyanobacteria bacterium P01_D01_bin.56]
MSHLPDKTPPDPNKNEILKQILDLAKKNPAVAITLALTAVILSGGGIKFDFGDGGCFGIVCVLPQHTVNESVPQKGPPPSVPKEEIQQSTIPPTKQPIERELNVSLQIWLEELFKETIDDVMSPSQQDVVSSHYLRYQSSDDVLEEFLDQPQSFSLLESNAEEQLSQLLSDRGNPYPAAERVPEPNTLLGVFISGLAGASLLRRISNK